MLSSTGATSDALEHHRLALGVMQALATTAPDDPANLRQLGVAYHKLGNSSATRITRTWATTKAR